MMKRRKNKNNIIYSYNEILKAAQEYGSLGFRMFPLGEASKAPRPGFKGWPEKATTNARTIEEWFKGKPLSNLGMALGQGLVAIDLDPAHGGFESFKELVKGKELPFTAVAETGSGGRHYLFRFPPDVRVRNRTNLLPGLDVRGDGGYIVVEPSVHPNGNRYRWIYGPEQAIALAPAWLVDFMLAPRTGPGNEAQTFKCRDGLVNDLYADESILLTDVLKRFPVTAIGQRNGKLAQVIASLLGRRYETGIVERVALDWWEHCYRLGTIGTEPSGALAEIRSVVASTLKNSNFRQCLGRKIDHRAELRQIRLMEEQIREIRSILAGNTIFHTCNSSNSESVHQHEAFVEALVVHFTHERACKPNGPLKATWTQLAQIMEDRHGLCLRNPQIDRLMSKFITRKDKPAGLKELAIQTVKGRTGKPSEFELTGLRQVLQASPGGLV